MSFRKLLLSFACAVLCVAAPAAAQQAETGGFAFLRLDGSARATALGGALPPTATADANALFHYPALLGADAARQASASYVNLPSDLKAGFLAYGHAGPRGTTLAAGLRFLSWGEMEGADASGTRTERFGASSVALTVGAAGADHFGIRYGAAVGVASTHVAEARATALTADLSAAWTHAPSRTTVAASLQHLGFVLNSLGATDDELPVDLRVAVSRRLQYVPLLVSVAGYRLNDLNDRLPGSSTLDGVLEHIILGGEFQPADAFHIRLGYNHRRHQLLKMKERLDLAGVSAGFGLRLARVRVDYGYGSWSSAGAVHQLTVSTRL